jgi:hypothetical protein
MYFSGLEKHFSDVSQVFPFLRIVVPYVSLAFFVRHLKNKIKIKISILA